MLCFTCRVLAGEDTGATLIWQDDLIVVNHTDISDRTGWFVVSPVRHVTRFFEMTVSERRAVVDAAALLDSILTESFGSTRTMIASLGWLQADHVHIHVVPTFNQDVTNGYLNFGDAYVPIDVPVEKVASVVAAAFKARQYPVESN